MNGRQSSYLQRTNAQVTEFHTGVVAVDLKTDAPGFDEFRRKIVDHGGLLTVTQTVQRFTFDSDLEEGPVALQIGLQRAALPRVN